MVEVDHEQVPRLELGDQVSLRGVTRRLYLFLFPVRQKSGISTCAQRYTVRAKAKAFSGLGRQAPRVSTPCRGMYVEPRVPQLKHQVTLPTLLEATSSK